MMAYLQIFVLAIVAVAVLAQDCDPMNCPACPVGTPFCDHHGGCHCHHHVRAAHCTTDTDCIGTLTCNHGQHPVCDVLHGTGGGSGEKACTCAKHKRATGCCNSGDCDATALNCAHNQIAVCELAHGVGGQCSENTCKCASKH